MHSSGVHFLLFAWHIMCDSAQATPHLQEIGVLLCRVLVFNEQALEKDFPDEPEELDYDFVVVSEVLGLRVGALHSRHFSRRFGEGY